jgi:hypothetical protein
MAVAETLRLGETVGHRDYLTPERGRGEVTICLKLEFGERFFSFLSDRADAVQRLSYISENGTPPAVLPE